MKDSGTEYNSESLSNALKRAQKSKQTVSISLGGSTLGNLVIQPWILAASEVIQHDTTTAQEAKNRSTTSTVSGITSEAAVKANIMLAGKGNVAGLTRQFSSVSEGQAESHFHKKGKISNTPAASLPSSPSLHKNKEPMHQEILSDLLEYVSDPACPLFKGSRRSRPTITSKAVERLYLIGLPNTDGVLHLLEVFEEENVQVSSFEDLVDLSTARCGGRDTLIAYLLGPKCTLLSNIAKKNLNDEIDLLWRVCGDTEAALGLFMDLQSQQDDQAADSLPFSSLSQLLDKAKAMEEEKIAKKDVLEYLQDSKCPLWSNGSMKQGEKGRMQIREEDVQRLWRVAPTLSSLSGLITVLEDSSSKTNFETFDAMLACASTTQNSINQILSEVQDSKTALFSSPKTAKSVSEEDAQALWYAAGENTTAYLTLFKEDSQKRKKFHSVEGLINAVEDCAEIMQYLEDEETSLFQTPLIVRPQDAYAIWKVSGKNSVDRLDELRFQKKSFHSLNDLMDAVKGLQARMAAQTATLVYLSNPKCPLWAPTAVTDEGGLKTAVKPTHILQLFDNTPAQSVDRVLKSFQAKKKAFGSIEELIVAMQTQLKLEADIEQILKMLKEPELNLLVEKIRAIVTSKDATQIHDIAREDAVAILEHLSELTEEEESPPPYLSVKALEEQVQLRKELLTFLQAPENKLLDTKASDPSILKPLVFVAGASNALSYLTHLMKTRKRPFQSQEELVEAVQHLHSDHLEAENIMAMLQAPHCGLWTDSKAQPEFKKADLERLLAVTGSSSVLSGILTSLESSGQQFMSFDALLQTAVMLHLKEGEGKDGVQEVFEILTNAEYELLLPFVLESVGMPEAVQLYHLAGSHTKPHLLNISSRIKTAFLTTFETFEKLYDEVEYRQELLSFIKRRDSSFFGRTQVEVSPDHVDTLVYISGKESKDRLNILRAFGKQYKTIDELLDAVKKIQENQDAQNELLQFLSDPQCPLFSPKGNRSKRLVIQNITELYDFFGGTPTSIVRPLQNLQALKKPVDSWEELLLQAREVLEVEELDMEEDALGEEVEEEEEDTIVQLQEEELTEVSRAESVLEIEDLEQPDVDVAGQEIITQQKHSSPLEPLITKSRRQLKIADTSSPGLKLPDAAIGQHERYYIPDSLKLVALTEIASDCSSMFMVPASQRQLRPLLSEAFLPPEWSDQHTLLVLQLRTWCFQSLHESSQSDENEVAFEGNHASLWVDEEAETAEEQEEREWARRYSLRGHDMATFKFRRRSSSSNRQKEETRRQKVFVYDVNTGWSIIGGVLLEKNSEDDEAASSGSLDQKAVETIQQLLKDDSTHSNFTAFTPLRPQTTPTPLNGQDQTAPSATKTGANSARQVPTLSRSKSSASHSRKLSVFNREAMASTTMFSPSPQVWSAKKAARFNAMSKNTAELSAKKVASPSAFQSSHHKKALMATQVSARKAPKPVDLRLDFGSPLVPSALGHSQQEWVPETPTLPRASSSFTPGLRPSASFSMSRTAAAVTADQDENQDPQDTVVYYSTPLTREEAAARKVNALLHGYLGKKASSGMGSWQKRYFVLNEYGLSYLKNQTAFLLGEQPLALIPMFCIISAHKVRPSGHHKGSSSKLGRFDVVVGETTIQKKFELQAPSDGEATKWVEALESFRLENSAGQLAAAAGRGHGKHRGGSLSTIDNPNRRAFYNLNLQGEFWKRSDNIQKYSVMVKHGEFYANEDGGKNPKLPKKAFQTGESDMFLEYKRLGKFNGMDWRGSDLINRAQLLWSFIQEIPNDKFKSLNKTRKITTKSADLVVQALRNVDRQRLKSDISGNLYKGGPQNSGRAAREWDKVTASQVEQQEMAVETLSIVFTEGLNLKHVPSKFQSKLPKSPVDGGGGIQVLPLPKPYAEAGLTLTALCPAYPRSPSRQVLGQGEAQVAEGDFQGGSWALDERAGITAIFPSEEYFHGGQQIDLSYWLSFRPTEIQHHQFYFLPSEGIKAAP